MCDFGSAKQLKAGEPNISYICSRCYRAPELIFGNSQYSTQIDVWSAGCVLGEMFLGVPLFQGESNIDQLVEIIKVLGCPSSREILEMNPDHDVNKFQLPKIPSKSWQKVHFLLFRHFQAATTSVRSSSTWWRIFSSIVPTKDTPQPRCSAIHSSTNWDARKYTDS